jgi:hypothetical protein
MKDFLQGIKLGMVEFGNNLNGILVSLILLFVYILGVGSTALIAKLIGKHFLDLNSKKKKSYWVDLNLSKKELREYLNQF